MPTRNIETIAQALTLAIRTIDDKIDELHQRPWQSYASSAARAAQIRQNYQDCLDTLKALLAATHPDGSL